MFCSGYATQTNEAWFLRRAANCSLALLWRGYYTSKQVVHLALSLVAFPSVEVGIVPVFRCGEKPG